MMCRVAVVFSGMTGSYPAKTTRENWLRVLEIDQEDDIELTEKHWEIIYFLRNFYKQHEISPPSNRLFVKAVREALGDEKGDSIYLMTLFPGTPAKTACRIAGLPRPTNCL